MNDRSMNITLIIMFGLSGLVMILLAWLHPSVVPQRAMAFGTGTVGLLVASLRVLSLRQNMRDNTPAIAVRVSADRR